MSRAVHPGRMLKHELDARRMTQKELAEALGKPAQAISEIVTGKKRITPKLSIALADLWHVSPHLWYTMQAQYEVTHALEEMRR